MPGPLFFVSVEQVNQWMGNLFYRKVLPSEILSMSYQDLKYWNSWHEIMCKKEAEKIPTV